MYYSWEVITLQIKVDRGLLKKLDKAGDIAKIQRIITRNGSEMKRSAMSSAPVDTGHLKRSINMNMGDYSVTVKASAEYASYVEYGTRYMSAQPFIRPSYYKQEKIFKQDIDKLMR